MTFLAVGMGKGCRTEFPKHLPQFDGWPESLHHQHGSSCTGQQETKDKRQQLTLHGEHGEGREEQELKNVDGGKKAVLSNSNNYPYL